MSRFPAPATGSGQGPGLLPGARCSLREGRAATRGLQALRHLGTCARSWLLHTARAARTYYEPRQPPGRVLQGRPGEVGRRRRTYRVARWVGKAASLTAQRSPWGRDHRLVGRASRVSALAGAGAWERAFLTSPSPRLLTVLMFLFFSLRAFVHFTNARVTALTASL